jgi:hypothetical protein
MRKMRYASTLRAAHKKKFTDYFVFDCAYYFRMGLRHCIMQR